MVSLITVLSRHLKRYKNLALQALGLGFVGLGIVGIALPVMPTTIFFIAALACFTHSSPRLEAWLLEHPRFGPILSAWRQHKVVPTKAKWLAALGMSIGLYMMMFSTAPSYAVVLVAAIEACVLVYLIRRPSCAESLYRSSPQLTAFLIIIFLTHHLFLLYLTRY